MRWLPTAVAVIVGGSTWGAGAPVAADTNGAGGISVTVGDHAWTDYTCVRHPVTLRASVSPRVVWGVSLTSGRTGQRQLDGSVVADVGPGTVTSSILLCPWDSDGPWTVMVTGRVGLAATSFNVGFAVRKMSAAVTVSAVRVKAGATKVRGRLTGTGGLPLRGQMRFSVVRGQQIRKLGHAYAKRDGNYRFVAPRRTRPGSVVTVEYRGDQISHPANTRAVVPK